MEEIEEDRPIHPVVLRLRRRRESMGISQRAMAKRIGTTQSAISEMECGHHMPNLDLLDRYADVVEMRIVADEL